MNTIKNIAEHEEVVAYLKKCFSRLDKNAAIVLAKKILEHQPEIQISEFKQKYDTFVRRNSSKIYEHTNEKGDIEYYLSHDYIQNLRDKLQKLLKKISASIQEIDSNENKWSKTKIDGEEAYEISKHTSFQDIRQKIDEEGKDVIFKYPFKNPDLKVDYMKNQMSLQMVDVHINDNGEYFGFPLKYVYLCPECLNITSRKEYEVASVKDKIKCPHYIEYETEKGEIKSKRCNTALEPDKNRTETKDSYTHKITFNNEYGELQKADAITFQSLPKGHLRVVLQKLPRAYGQQFVHIVDYQPLEKEEINIPEQDENEHYIFTLIRQMDEYIQEKTGYYHFGFLPMKMAMIIQFAGRYVPHFINNFHMMMTGAMSSGKSQFAKYWGIALYSQDCWVSNATSISIPKLRGTMETFNLFGKDYRYQYRGLLGEKDLIIIDELKESPDVKQNLKQYALEQNYDYSKQGGNNNIFERTAQLVVTQNTDTVHLDRYAKEVKKIYMSDEIGPVDTDDEPKPYWDDSQDLTLPLYQYSNKYLRYSIKKVRDMYARNQINWIDGSELALKQRFVFYFFLESEKTNKELTNVIRENNSRRKIEDNVEMIKLMSCRPLKEMFEQKDHLFEGTNDMEYFDRVDNLLDEYDKTNDARTKSISYLIIKLLRIIDNRDYCTDKDLEIFQYIIENIDNKIDIADTNEYMINGSHHVDDSDIEENINNSSDEFGFESSIASFEE